MRRIVGSIATLALAVTGLIVHATTASAEVRAAFSYTIHRLPYESTKFDFREGESATTTATFSLGPDWTGWPETRTSTMTFTQGPLYYTESINPDDTASAPGIWHFYSSTDPESCDYWSLSTNLSLPVSRSCVDTVDLVTSLYGEQFASDNTLEFDLTSWAIYRSGVAQTVAHNASWSLYADVTGTSDSAAPLQLFAGSDVSVSVEIEGCVNESAPGLTDGDAVVQEVIASIDGEPISEIANSDDPVAAWTTAPTYDEDGNQVDGPTYPMETISFDTDPAENETLGVTGEITNLTGAALAISYDITKDGVSVAEDCPLGDFVGMPTLSDTTATGDVFDASATSHALPDGMTVDAASVRTMNFAPDGFGGEFVFPKDEWGEAFTGAVFHLTPDGPDNEFSGGDGLALSSSIGLMEFKGTAWGVNGTRWATFHYSSSTRFTITIGTMASAATTSVRARISKIDGVCGTGWFASLERFLPVQTSKLLVEIQCSKYTATRSYNKTVIARVTLDSARPFRTIATIGTPTRKYPTTCTAIGVDPTASGTDTAVIAMSRKLKYTRESCENLPASGDITLTRLNADLSVSRKTVTTNPFAGGTVSSWPSDGIALVPGEATNTWRGMQINREWDEAFETSTVTWTPFTVSAGRVIVELPDLAGADRFGTGNIDSGTLIATPGLSDWVLMNVESDEFDGDTTTYVTSSTMNPLTGESQAGESVLLTNFGYTHGWMYQSATSKDGIPIYYVLGPDDTYSVIRWDRAE